MYCNEKKLKNAKINQYSYLLQEIKAIYFKISNDQEG